MDKSVLQPSRSSPCIKKPREMEGLGWFGRDSKEEPDCGCSLTPPPSVLPRSQLAVHLLLPMVTLRNVLFNSSFFSDSPFWYLFFWSHVKVFYYK